MYQCVILCVLDAQVLLT